MARLAVFAYGSLVDPASASVTLERRVERVWPAHLHGWRRRFSQARDNRACEKTFARADDGTIPERVLGLNIEHFEGREAAPNGALIEVTEAELDRLNVREMRYDRVQVTAEVAAGEAPEFDLVYAYVAKAAHFAPETPAGAVILRRYAATVEAAFEALGPGERDEYVRTTLPYPAELIDGHLIRDEIPAGNPREW
jgi:cation transport regulator ChaC